MIVGKKYLASEINARYDAIVIGSGLGGLTTAALLAKAGNSVLVLERHYTAGGFTHSFQRKGYEWDVGVHYIGEVHRPDAPLRRVFDYITDGKLQWAKMDAVYDRILIAGDEYAFVAGARNFREELLRSFPKAGAEIDAYLHHIRQASRSIATHFARRHMPAIMQSALGLLPQRNRIDYFGRTTRSVMADCIHDPKLASVLCGQWGDYGLPPGQSSFGMHAVVAQHYLGGASFPVGGASQIAHHIVPVIERAGGSVRVDAEVESVLVDKDRAIGVRMANGDEIRATQVISAVGLFNTYQKLIPESVGQRLGMPEKLDRFKPSMAHLGLYLGIKATAQELGLEQANRWVYQDYDHDASLARFLDLPTPNGSNGTFPVSFLSFPSAKDPAWTHNHPGTATIDVVAPAPYQWFEPWQHMPWKRRGADYEDLKQSLTEQLLAEVYRQVPQVRGKIDYCELSTPLSTAHFGNYAQGQVYGMDHSPQRFAQSWVKPSTPIKNFYLTGQDIMTCGVAAAMMAGVMTAINALGTTATVLLPEVLAPQSAWGHQATRTLSRLGRPPLSGTKTRLAPPEPKARSFAARCVARVPLTHDVVALRFAVPDTALAFKPGQFVTLALDINSQQHFRSYTIASSPAQGSTIELIIKRVDQGLVSNWLCDTVQPGTVVSMSGPHGSFTCAPRPRPKLLMLSAGSGVTPMLSMTRWLRDSGTRADVVFFHSARTTRDLICDDEVQAMAQTLPHFARHISLTRSTRTVRHARKGHIDAAMLHAIAPDFMEREVYVCGPQGFMASVREILQTARFGMRHHHEENFDASVKASGGRVSFARSGLAIDAAGEVSLLDIAQQAGVSIANACRTGECGECKAKKCSGEVLMANTAGLAANEEDEGYVLTCVGYANGAVTLDA